MNILIKVKCSQCNTTLITNIESKDSGIILYVDPCLECIEYEIEKEMERKMEKKKLAAEDRYN